MDTVFLFLDRKGVSGWNISDKVHTLSGEIYEVQDRINSGGNAVVHRCLNAKTGDEFAIKFLLTLSEKMRKRFLQEIQLLEKIKHPHLIELIDFGSANGEGKKGTGEVPFLIMPIADSNLLELINKRRPEGIKYAEYMPQFKGLALALYKLHEQAIHRDIKPENILIIGEKWVLSDFGLCKFNNGNCEEISGDQEHIGPKYWMSPEAINKIYGNRDTISQVSDIYQLCCIFWFVVTGRHPSGILCKNDWTGPEHLFPPIFDSLAHSTQQRIGCGMDLHNSLYEASLVTEKKGLCTVS